MLPSRSLNSTSSIAVLVVIVAFCSLGYELLLAQTLTTFFGNTFNQYSLTVGIYLFALGMGGIVAGFLPERADLGPLGWVEVSLTLLGGFAPLIAGLLVAHVTFAYEAVLALIVLIGLLSGLEIPLFIRVARRAKCKESALFVVAWDFVGTFAASVLFALLLYPLFGLVGSAAGMACMNGFVAVWLFRAQGKRLVWPVLGCALMLVMLVYHKQVSQLLSHAAFGGAV